MLEGNCDDVGEGDVACADMPVSVEPEITAGVSCGAGSAGGAAAKGAGLLMAATAGAGAAWMGVLAAGFLIGGEGKAGSELGSGFASLGGGCSTAWANITIGTTNSTVRGSIPLYSVYRSPACRNATHKAMAVSRLKVGTFERDGMALQGIG